MYARSLQIPPVSFFLFGPRSTGKTTWLKEKLPDAAWYNLLLERDYLNLSADPSLLISSVSALEADRWVVIDEVQKLPILLNSVHYLLGEYPDKYRFALSGSSARKLRRMQTNLLAGRVIQRRFFPLTWKELGAEFQLDRALDVGLLPLIWTHPTTAEDRLFAYVNTYLKQEIQQEALVGDVPSFNRFLRIAALLNGHSINTSNISRDAGVARKTVERYFDILVDTLVAYWLPAWQPKATVKEVSKPKFYFFDCGVARACANRLGLPPTPEESGFLLETYILHEIRAYMNAAGIRGELSYWRSGSGNEVDVIWSLGDTHVGFEIKSSTNWKHTYSRGLRSLQKQNKIKKAYGVYRGDRALLDDTVKIYPIHEFLRALYDGSLLISGSQT